MKYLFSFIFHAGYLTKVKDNSNNYVIPRPEIRQKFMVDVLQFWLEKRFPGLKLKDDGISLILSVMNSGEFKKNINSTFQEVQESKVRLIQQILREENNQ